MSLTQAGHELFSLIESNFKKFQNPDVSSCFPYSDCQSTLGQLVELIEQARQIVKENETAVQTWLGQMIDDFQYQQATPPRRGVLATYLQQRLATPQCTAMFEEVPESSGHHSAISSSSAVPSPNPWVTSHKDSGTMGRQVNQQS